ncbi:MAG TPA: ribosome maturation factor RimM [Pseudomonadales bacterium]|nr:ribosome maturation factor RimM [Pseudomonadales bacterium]
MIATPSDQYLVAGKITGAYGIKGWVKVHAFLDQPQDIAHYVVAFRRPDGVAKPIKLVSVKPHGKGLVAQIDGIHDRNGAELLAHCELLMLESALPDLEGEDYYWYELEGLRVFVQSAQDRILLGEVNSLFETGANDVMVVKACEGSLDQRERLIPYILEQVVLAIDLEAGEMLVDWDPEF